ncbi:Recombination endonuclease VII [uncultured archaeon]|nr:Recombination endonuclease VII [uncultured archaeon]
MSYSRAKNLLEKYALTPQEYAQIALDQGGVCKCCGKAPTGRDLHVDHDHKVARTKFSVVQLGTDWVATCQRFNHVCYGTSRENAERLMKFWLLRKSVRGLLCWACNSGIRKFLDKPELLRSAANYLVEFGKSLV